MKTGTYDENEDDLQTARDTSRWAIEQARQVHEDMKSGRVKVPQAVELNNAIGKANAAVGNLLKGVVVKLTLQRMEDQALAERAKVAAAEDRPKRLRQVS